MTDALSPPTSPIKDKFNFEWFSFNFDNKSPAKHQTSVSPLSPASAPHVLPNTNSDRDTFFSHNPIVDSSSQPSKTSNTHRPRAAQIVYPPPPDKPLSWVWQCHMCRSRYPLSVTRRCLIDGHYYCSGDSNNQRNTKRRRKAQSCTSEFDYVGWRDWGQWRRKCMALQSLTNMVARGPGSRLMLTGCQGCNFPSQCRYEQRPRYEVVEPETYIDEDELAKIESELGPDENLGIVSFDKQAFWRQPDSLKSSDKGRFFEKIGEAKERNKLQKKTTKLDANPAPTVGGDKSSRRQRFYSSFTTNTSTSLPSSNCPSTSQPLTSPSKPPGSFDPNLPSLSTTPNSTTTDLSAIESTLKSTLSAQKSISTSSSSAKQRGNSNSTVQEFTINHTDTMNVTFHPSGGPLTRTTSQQRLLSGFVRANKHPHHPPPPNSDSGNTMPATRRAASEADIASFLQLKTGLDVPPRTDTRNFEDIALSPPSPSTARGAGAFREDFGGEEDGGVGNVKAVGEAIDRVSFLGMGFGFGGRK
ncbi:hypothetical protein H2198_009539 [Neophaeococcomyces mojaviensis]|uniref:Uncharacterized protein n=1 Tax=Neophaeococcomyces mojaviensis TaxID=3383035 RepID=A0ACC2ZUJ0_9EURO|nr:hypothetical protein H2198_009539 [Knufia sp. JES_112]